MHPTATSLYGFNTLRLNYTAPYLLQAHNDEDVMAALHWAKQRQCDVLPLGEGSNIVLTQAPQSLVLVLRHTGVTLLSEDDKVWRVRVAAGQCWHDFVRYCLHKGWYGLENLALIPGTVGAAPIQNIGAYGVEVAQYIEAVECIHQHTLERQRRTAFACDFSYRHSWFKSEAGRPWIVQYVTFSLPKQYTPRLGYAALSQYFEQSNIRTPHANDVFQAVVAIRSQRLPDVNVIGNVGSFFHNPVVSSTKLKKIQQQYPDIPFYPQPDNTAKLAAAWLIEHCGWKGYRSGDAGVFDRQALVLVNHGEATGKDILALAARIQQDVQKRFDIPLCIEPRVI